MIKILIIALVIYLLVVTRARIRLPHPGLQATVDVLKAADLSDDEVQRMAAQYVRYCDAQNRVAPAGDPYAERLARLTGRYVAVNGIPLNFKVYKTTAVNAFATADGSIRVFSGLMDRLGDDELMAIVGHEMGHVRNHDTIGAMRKAYLASAARSALGAVGGALGALSASQLGSIAEQYASAQFSQGQETLADDFSFGFLIRNGYDPYAMASALEKITQISRQGGSEADEVMQLFSTHPDSAWRAARMRSKAISAAGRELSPCPADVRKTGRSAMGTKDAGESRQARSSGYARMRPKVRIRKPLNRSWRVSCTGLPEKTLDGEITERDPGPSRPVAGQSGVGGQLSFLQGTDAPLHHACRAGDVCRYSSGTARFGLAFLGRHRKNRPERHL